MMSCIKATEQISQQLDRALSITERVQLKTHLLMCSKCSRCADQLAQLHRIASQRGKVDPES